MSHKKLTFKQTPEANRQIRRVDRLVKIQEVASLLHCSHAVAERFLELEERINQLENDNHSHREDN